MHGAANNVIGGLFIPRIDLHAQMPLHGQHLHLHMQHSAYYFLVCCKDDILRT